MHTSVGLLLSFGVYLACSVYAFAKFGDLYEGNDPNVNVAKTYGMFPSYKKGFNLAATDFKFKIGFVVKEMDSRRYLQNENFVEWEAVIVEGNLTHNYINPIKVPTHKCTEDDYKDFYAPIYAIEENLKQLEELKPHLYCIDETDEKGNKIDQTSFFGHTDGTLNRRLDIIYKPCTPQKLTDANKHLVNSRCLANLNNKKSLKRRLKKSIDYLGEPELKLVYNHERIDTS